VYAASSTKSEFISYMTPLLYNCMCAANLCHHWNRNYLFWVDCRLKTNFQLRQKTQKHALALGLHMVFLAQSYTVLSVVAVALNRSECPTCSFNLLLCGAFYPWADDGSLCVAHDLPDPSMKWPVNHFAGTASHRSDVSLLKRHCTGLGPSMHIHESRDLTLSQ
jgi:hypothetical protein